MQADIRGVRTESAAAAPSKPIWRLVGAAAAYLIMAALLRWPETAAQAIHASLAQWYNSILPALFPFMMLMPLITCREALDIYEKLLGRAMLLLTGLPGRAAPAVAASMIAGSPAGAIISGKIAADSAMEKRQLIRIVGCAGGLSPAFIINGVGAGILKDAAFGVMLLKAQILTQMIMLVATRGYCGGERVCPDGAKQSEGAANAVLSAIMVAGYMAFFAMLSGFISNLTKTEAAECVICILEISGGIRFLAGTDMVNGVKAMLIAGICGFGGISICAQNMKILGRYGIAWREYLPWKLASGMIQAVLIALFIYTENKNGPASCENGLYISALFAVFLTFPAIKGIGKTIT